MALSAINNTPKLADCTPISFIAALMNAAQFGLEPNTPLEQAYLILYKNKSVLECQFQFGYRGMIDLAYRNERMQSIEAQTVYKSDEFFCELGLQPVSTPRPTFGEPEDIRAFYAIFRLDNGGYQFEVMSKAICMGMQRNILRRLPLNLVRGKVSEMGLMTAIIHNSHFGVWITTKEELYRLAKINTPELLPAKNKTMKEVYV